MTDRRSRPEPTTSLACSEAREADRRRVALEAAAWLSAIVENSSDAILSKTMDGIITTWNAGAQALFGYPAVEVIGKPITILIPSDRLHEEEVIISRLRAGETVEQFETVRRRKDGSQVHVALSVSPVKDEDGHMLGASKIARDITAAKQATARQELVIEEMNHRIKNLFALTISLVALSERATDSAAELAADLSMRLQALSRAHGLILPDYQDDSGARTGTTLPMLLGEILAPYLDDVGSRIDMAGDAVAVGPHALPTLALLFHELATNATKYGSLACPSGHLRIDIVSRGSLAEVSWCESGAPARDGRPSGAGFGTRLERASVASLHGALERTWHDDGLDILLTLPLENIAR